MSSLVDAILGPKQRWGSVLPGRSRLMVAGVNPGRASPYTQRGVLPRAPGVVRLGLNETGDDAAGIASAQDAAVAGTSIDPTHASFNDPAARALSRTVGQVALAVVSRAPVVGQLIALARLSPSLQRAIPASAAPAPAVDPVDPTTGVSQISPANLSAANALLDKAMAASAAGDFATADAAATAADQLAGGQLGKGAGTLDVGAAIGASQGALDLATAGDLRDVVDATNGGAGGELDMGGGGGGGVEISGEAGAGGGPEISHQ
jgi:hypothetical protein